MAKNYNIFTKGGEIVAETETFLNFNSMRKWARQQSENGENLISDLADLGRDTARAFAPEGDHHGAPRAGHTHFKDSIVEVVYSGGQERGWGTTASHYHFYVKGTRPHLIRGKLNFPWSNTGEHFHWENYRYGPYGSGKNYENWDLAGGATVKHPGTRPMPDFLKESFEHVAMEAPSYMRRAF